MWARQRRSQGQASYRQRKADSGPRRARATENPRAKPKPNPTAVVKESKRPNLEYGARLAQFLRLTKGLHRASLLIQNPDPHPKPIKKEAPKLWKLHCETISRGAP